MEAAEHFTTCGALHNREATSSIPRWFVGLPPRPPPPSSGDGFLFALCIGPPRKTAFVGAEGAAWTLSP